MRPNILFIMADQMRADWLGARPALADMPNLDALLARSTVFPQAICNAPVCAPSRAALAAGIYSFRMGATSNRNNFPVDQPTLYQALRRGGYRVGMVGKMDLHKPDHYYGPHGDVPLMFHLGFTDLCETEGKMNAARVRTEPTRGAVRPRADAYRFQSAADLAGPYQHYLYERGLLDAFVQDTEPRKERLPVWYTAPSVLPDEAYHDRFIGRAARAMLERWRSEEPWFLCVSFVGPHDPWDAPASVLARYAQRTYDPPPPDAMTGKPDYVRQRQWRQSGQMTADALMEVKRHYAANITVIDEEIGQIVSLLKTRGALDNTVIVFTADHGEMLGDHGLFQKSIMYEGALRVPLFITLSGQQEGRTSSALAELVDLFPTFLELAGIEYERGVLDGRSLCPQLEGVEKSHKPLQFSHLERSRMVFDGRYKLIDHANVGQELYDLAQDPLELENRVDVSPQIVRRLAGALQDCYRQLRPARWPDM